MAGLGRELERFGTLEPDYFAVEPFARRLRLPTVQKDLRAITRARPLLCVLLIAAMSACSGAEPNTPAPPTPTVSPTPAQTATSPPLQTRVTVALNHCDFVPLKYNGKYWEVSSSLYHGTNRPPRWKGRGRVVALTADHLRYRDDSGIELEFVLGDGKLPPCA